MTVNLLGVLGASAPAELTTLIVRYLTLGECSVLSRVSRQMWNVFDEEVRRRRDGALREFVGCGNVVEFGKTLESEAAVVAYERSRGIGVNMEGFGKKKDKVRRMMIYVRDGVSLGRLSTALETVGYVDAVKIERRRSARRCRWRRMWKVVDDEKTKWVVLSRQSGIMGKGGVGVRSGFGGKVGLEVDLLR